MIEFAGFITFIVMSLDLPFTSSLIICVISKVMHSFRNMLLGIYFDINSQKD